MTLPALAALVAVSCTGIFTDRELPSLDARSDIRPDGADGETEGHECPDGQILCGSFCIDPRTDRLNCGGCSTVCSTMEQCVDGDCACEAPFLLCSGECVDPRIDRRHCGTCGNTCDALAVCVAGSCACSGSRISCGGVCVDPDTDRDNCGSCGNICEPSQVCNGSGVCSTECGIGFTLCDAGANPYCADTAGDPLNCGACHNSCGPYV